MTRKDTAVLLDHTHGAEGLHCHCAVILKIARFLFRNRTVRKFVARGLRRGRGYFAIAPSVATVGRNPPFLARAAVRTKILSP